MDRGIKVCLTGHQCLLIRQKPPMTTKLIQALLAASPLSYASRFLLLFIEASRKDIIASDGLDVNDVSYEDHSPR